jgi:hypothetical protein
VTVEQSSYRSSGPTITPDRVVRDAAPVAAERGHHCLYEYRGETCPPGGCSTSGTATDNRFDRSGIRDGVRCTGCGRWAETPEGINHRELTCAAMTVPAHRRRVSP